LEEIMLKRFKLILDVTFEPNGVSDAELKGNLEYIVQHAMSAGLLTGETEAEVETYDVNIEEVPTTCITETD
jgi:hypothetical protein